MDNAPELPESEDALYELAARSDADPYRREAAIKKLGELESDESSTQLEHLTEDGVSAIERQLAENSSRLFTASQLMTHLQPSTRMKSL